MKKTLEILSLIIAISGALAIAITTYALDNYILFYIGVVMLVIGITGILLSGKKYSEFIGKILDLI